MNGNNYNDNPLFNVKLKPLFGIEPKVYVLFLTFILIFLAILIFIVLKLKNPKAYLTINANISNSYVFYNKKYLGKTPLKKYIPISKGILEIKRIGYKTHKENIEIKNNFFFNSKTLNIKLKLNDPYKILTLREKELSIMSQTKNFTENIKPIPVFSLINSELKEHPKFIKKFLMLSISYINSNEIFEDFIKVYKENYSLNTSAKSLFESLKKEFNINENSIIWFLSNFKEKEAKSLLNENWVKEILSKTNKKIEIESENKSFNYIISGFKKLNQNTITTNTEYKITKDYKINIINHYLLREFLIQNNNVTKKEYQEFLEENPNWKIENKINLINNKLVDESYLKDFTKTSQYSPVTYISYFAAKEYAAWYSKKLPKELKARLPLSIEFELSEKNNSVNLNIMNVNEISKKVGFWNIMEDYNPKSSYLFKKNIYDDIKSNSLISDIRTYNYKNNKIINSSTKAYLMKNWTAPNIGFKLVIIRK